jgi:hypothetical protein
VLRQAYSLRSWKPLYQRSRRAHCSSYTCIKRVYASFFRGASRGSISPSRRWARHQNRCTHELGRA